ncbi:MAG: alpha/beta hydrolase [Pseudomonadota bacterium]
MNRANGIEYEERGTGDVPVVCIHGIGGNTHSFARQLEGLSDHLRIVAINLPGYGRSDTMADPTFPKLAAELTAFLDALDVEKAHLCGQSIGGMVALETACLHPNRVASLALIGTTSAFGGRDDSFKDTFVAARLKPLDEGMSLPELAEQFVPEITGPDATPQVLKEATASMAAVPQQTYRAIIACLVTFDRRDDVAGIEIPACLISGSHDTNAPAKTMARMAEKMPRAEYHEIEGAGHLINLEASSKTNRILRTFYGRQ